MGVLTACAVYGLIAPPLYGQDAETKETYAERYTFDAERNAWSADQDPVPNTEAGDLELARRALARGESKTAKKLLKKWVKTYGTDAPRYDEALFYLGDVEFQRRNYMKAHERYKELIDGYPGSAFIERAVRRDFIVAETFLAGEKQKFLGLAMFSADEEALEILEDIIAGHPGSEMAEQAVRTRANHFYREGDFDAAAIELDRITRDYPRSRYARTASLRSAQATLASFPGVEFDASPLLAAEEKFRQFQRAHPRFAEQQRVDLVLDRIRNSQAEKLYVVAEYYERVRRPLAARSYYESLAKRWPESTWGASARDRLTVMGYLASDASDRKSSEPSTEPPAGTP